MFPGHCLVAQATTPQTHAHTHRDKWGEPEAGVQSAEEESIPAGCRGNKAGKPQLGERVKRVYCTQNKESSFSFRL